jgi:hypothetical protein
VEQGDREREQDHHGGGEPASSRGQIQRCRGSRALRYAGGSESAAKGRGPSCENTQGIGAIGRVRQILSVKSG